jgi:CubicO group peptidase (beta-lactamase class C family)
MNKLILLCSLFLTTAAVAQPDRQAALLDSVFTVLHAQHQFNGSVLIAENDAVVFQKGYGYSNESTQQRNDPETIFELASCSKQFTAAAIVLLKRQGKLRYTDKLAQHIHSISPSLPFGMPLRSTICCGIPAVFPNIWRTCRRYGTKRG